MDAAAAPLPNPGWRPFQRLNRAEYARAIKDLLDVDVDVTALLPADTISDGFDNIADAQTFSPTLLTGYLRAASKVTSLAIGDLERVAAEANYKVPKTASQLKRVEGAPLGTRGGLSTRHTSFRPTANMCFAWTCTPTPAACSSADRRPASSSRSPSTANASRCSTSTRG